MKSRSLAGALLASSAILFTVTQSFAALGNVWHIPQNVEPSPVTMRNPLSGMTSGTTVFFYNGSYSLDGDQSGGQLIYKRSTDASWSTNSLSFDSQNGNNKYWKTSIAGGTFNPGDTVQYYFRITFTNRDTTFIYGTDSTTNTTGTEPTAQASPYTYTIAAPPPVAWPGFGYPSDPAANIHHWKEEAIVGNGYMTVMLDQNGTLYDIYYPSAGNRHGVSTANEGYRGPEEFPNCTSIPRDKQANGQMNVIAGMGGIAIPSGSTNLMYWLKNTNGVDYADIGQRWVSDDVNVVSSSNRLVAAGQNIKVEQYDFCPTPSALPVITSCPGSLCRTNYGVYVKRFLLTNLAGSPQTFNFYYDVNFNINGGNGNDVMYVDSPGVTNIMVAYDRTYRSVAPPATGCTPDGYTEEYSPAFAFNWVKSNSTYFAVAMKLVTNAVTGAGESAGGTWRDHTPTDNQEGWIGKTVTLGAGETKEIDVAIVGAWDDFSGATGTYDFWGKPLINWFYSNNMSNVQAATESYWSNWLASGVTIDFPGDVYDRLFKRSLLISALHVDRATGAIVAGMHNGAYPFVWPRDTIYAAITLDRTGHTAEGEGAYRWLRDIAYRDFDTGIGDKGYFYQKYTTDGYQVWTSPQIDETASVPWGLYYHYMVTGDSTFLTNYWNLAYTSARASSENSSINPDLFLLFNLMNSWNAWEDQLGLHIYSNTSIVRGLRDAANIADIVGSNTWATSFRARANNFKSGVDGRTDGRIEATDISHLGLVYPYEVYTPDEPRMTNVVEQLHGRQQSGFATSLIGSGPYYDNLVETSGDIVGLVRRFNHKTQYVSIDDYWNGGPWFLSTSWYGMYFARWQDYAGGKAMINTNKYTLDLLVAKLGPMGLGGEQIAPNTGAQKYPDFWLQTAWPNVWESHSTLVDQMMMFLDYKPQATNNTCYFAPKLPEGWSTITYNNMLFRDQRFNITITETDSGCSHNTRADLNKLTTGALNYDMYLRIPGGITPVMVVTNGGYYAPSPADYSTATGRVHVQGALNSGTGNNIIAVTYDIPGCGPCPCAGLSDWDGDGVADSTELGGGSSPLLTDTDGDAMPDGYEYNNGLNPSISDANGDLDGDGQSNVAEFQAGTFANNSTSSLRITSITRAGTVNTITWDSVSGKLYHLQSTDTLPGTFTDVPGPDIPASGSTTSTTDTTAVPGRHYRVRLVYP